MILKIVLYPILAGIISMGSYLAFWFVVRPYKKRKHFMKYPSVAVSPNFVPFLGDFKYLNAIYIEKNKFIGHFLRDLAHDFGKKPAFFASMGMEDMLFINDIELLSEVQNYVPSLLDREPIDTSGFGRVGGTGGLGQSKSTKYWMQRRETFIKTIGVNHASRFVPTILKHCEQEVKTFQQGQISSMSEYANTISFEIICEILYGCDIRDKLDLVNYTERDGNISKVNLYQCLMKISHDCSFAAMKPLNLMFPWFVKYDVGTENKRNSKNSDEFERVIRDVCEKSEDQNSVYNQVLNAGKIDKEMVYKDVMAILFGGHETTSKSLCNAMLHLKRNPDIEAKLRREMDEVLLENGKYTVKDLENILCNEKLEELDYLSCFLKEVLRHDPPAVRSLGYKAKTAFKIKDILVPKNQIVLFNLYACQYNEEQWQEPMKFIPERFDSESKYFLTPSGNTRHPLAYCPFTFGTRTCPGRGLGLMELKILVIYFMLSIDYEIDEGTLQNEDVSFAILSPFDLDIKVTKVHV
jgi:cytochrome P450